MIVYQMHVFLLDSFTINLWLNVDFKLIMGPLGENIFSRDTSDFSCIYQFFSWWISYLYTYCLVPPLEYVVWTIRLNFIQCLYLGPIPIFKDLTFRPKNISWCSESSSRRWSNLELVFIVIHPGCLPYSIFTLKSKTLSSYTSYLLALTPRSGPK